MALNVQRGRVSFIPHNNIWHWLLRTRCPGLLSGALTVCLALAFWYPPREGNTGTGHPGTPPALGELCGTAEDQQFLEDGTIMGVWTLLHPCFPLSIPVFLCSIPSVWWAVLCKDVPAHSWNDSVLPYWHFRALAQWYFSSEAPLKPQWENSSLMYRKLMHGMFPELYVFIRKLLSAVINASRALVFCTSGGKTVAVNRLPVWSFCLEYCSSRWSNKYAVL